MSTLTLTADCERCCGLCCVAPALVRSPEFALSKDAHAPCPNLERDFRCAIHAELTARGFSGCATYDCHGAGQHVTQVLFGGRTWSELDKPALMFDAFMLARDLFEQLSLLETALEVEAPAALQSRLGERAVRLRSLVSGTLAELMKIDVALEREETQQVLRGVARHVRRPEAQEDYSA